MALHHKSRTPEYRVWAAMIQRCMNPNSTNYKRYGGRGITVCIPWLCSFEQFVADMGPRPPGHSIDRINNDKGYSPDNCRWATPQEQVHNQRRYKAYTSTAARLGISLSHVSRIFNGKRCPSVRVLCRLAQDKGISIDALLEELEGNGRNTSVAR